MQLAFGAGALWGNRTDVTGTGIGPDQFAILQDVQIDFDWTTKELWGQFQFPVDIARGQGKITGKAKFARIFGAIYGDLFFGQTPAAGQVTVSENEAASVPATTPYTVAVANASGYVDDLGVYYASGNTAGGRFTRVTTHQRPGSIRSTRRPASTPLPRPTPTPRWRSAIFTPSPPPARSWR
jgi:hypothetical protein